MSKADRVILTGMTQEELRTIRGREGASGTRCYLCKRLHGDASLAIKVPGAADGPKIEEVEGNLFRIASPDGKPSFVDAEIRVEWVPIHDDEKTEFLVPLCQECSMILDRWSGRSES